MHCALMMPRFEINRQNTKGKLSTAFFSAIFEIQDVQDLWVSGNLFFVYDDNLFRECYTTLHCKPESAFSGGPVILCILVQQLPCFSRTSSKLSPKYIVHHGRK